MEESHVAFVYRGDWRRHRAGRWQGAESPAVLRVKIVELLDARRRFRKFALRVLVCEGLGREGAASGLSIQW